MVSEGNSLLLPIVSAPKKLCKDFNKIPNHNKIKTVQGHPSAQEPWRCESNESQPPQSPHLK